MKGPKRLYSCDTFVAINTSPSGAKEVIFGKNSDRPKNEVQEVVYVEGKTHGSEDKLQAGFVFSIDLPKKITQPLPTDL